MSSTVSYMGLAITVPSGFNYVAMDQNFFVYAFKNQPTFDPNANEWVFPTDLSTVSYLGTLHQLSLAPVSGLTVILNL
jgi:hypothetical protein